MTENAPPKSARRRAKPEDGRAHDTPDGNPKKQYPNGISSTVRAVYVNWHEVQTGEPGALNPKKFLEKTGFSAVWQDTLERYPGVARPHDVKKLEKLLRGVDVGDTPLSFHILRALSQFVGLETGLFLLFTQFVSLERHALAEGEDPREISLRFIGNIRRLVETVEKDIQDGKAGELIFNQKLSDTTFSVSMSVMKRWVDTYKDMAC